MKTLTITGTTGKCNIYADETIKNLKKYIDAERTIIITDTNVFNIYHKLFPKKIPVIKIGMGENIKNLDTVKYIYDKLIELEADRSTMLIGIGGGIVCDITGYCASTFMRSTRLALVPTTLLAQVDASIGGKNGINYHDFKNMIGTFRQPEFVLIDPVLLRTLPKREFRSGFAEIVKHGIVGSTALFEYMEKNIDKIIAKDTEVITKIIYSSLIVKLTIVKKDELEKGERQKLNFGHTFGHAIEKVNPGKFTHGEAVSIGMIMAGNISLMRNLISTNDFLRMGYLLQRLGLPNETKIDKEKILSAIKKDKKRSADSLNFVIIKNIGEVFTEKINFTKFANIIDEMSAQY